MPGIALVIAAAALWSTVGVAVRATPGAAELPAAVIGAARMCVAGPLLVLAGVLMRGRAALAGMRAGWIAAFALCNAIFQVALFLCLARLGVMATVFLTVCLPPVLLALVLPGGRSARPALGLAVAGVGLIAAPGGAGGLALPVAGLALAVLASAAFAGMSLALPRAAARGGPSMAVLGLGLSLSGALLGAAALPALPGVLRGGWPAASTWGLLVWLGLGPTALAYLLFAAGMARCRSAVAGLAATMVEPVFATGLAALVQGAGPGPGQAGGCALLLLAMVVLWRAEGGRCPPAPDGASPRGIWAQMKGRVRVRGGRAGAGSPLSPPARAG